MDRGNMPSWMMRDWPGRTVRLLLALAMVLGATQWGYGQSRGSLTSRRNRINQKITQTSAELRGIKERQQETTEQLAQVEREIGNAKSGIAAAQERWRTAKAKEEEAKKGYEAAVERYARQKEAFEERVVELYMGGETTYLEVLLEAKDFYDVVNRAYLCQKLVEADLALFGTIRREKDRLAKARDSWDQRAQEASASEARLQERKVALGVAQRRHQEILEATKQERERVERELAILQESSREVEAMIRSMMRTSAGQSRLKSRWAGGYLVPVSGSVTSGFGYRYHPILHSRRMHTGVDIAAPVGTSIAASAGGVVIFSGWMRGYGQTIVVDHGGGISTLYAHCSSLLAGEGASVRQGQVIARVGMTGMTTGPHVHWEKRVNGVPVNPL